jgi:hypothetical protein
VIVNELSDILDFPAPVCYVHVMCCYSSLKSLYVLSTILWYREVLFEPRLGSLPGQSRRALRRVAHGFLLLQVIDAILISTVHTTLPLHELVCSCGKSLRDFYPFPTNFFGHLGFLYGWLTTLSTVEWFLVSILA